MKTWDEFGPRFPDMSKSYTPEYRAVAHKVADKLGIKLDEGVYIGVTGRLMKRQQKSELIRHLERMQSACLLFLK